MLARRIAQLKTSLSLADALVPDAPTPPHAATPRQVLRAHFSFTRPEPCPDPALVAVVAATARLLGLDVASQTDAEREEMIAILAGNATLPKSRPWALAYGGHQFGSWAGQLGDGRAMSLAEFTHAGSSWEMQLKGVGRTPYSRFADGYAVLRSSIREFLAAEAMHALSVPTSRSLSLIATPRLIQRETIESGGIVCRVAPTWIRFGNFELFYARHDLDNLKKLADYTLLHHFILEKGDYVSWLNKVVEKTADMIAHWQAVGFCHGVMNTDNFSILGY